MLYQQLYAVALSFYAFLPSPIRGAVYYVSSNPSSNYQCPNDAECHIYCNVASNSNMNIYDCGDAVDCYFHCDEKKCGFNAWITGTNSDNLYITQSWNGQECLSSATVITPDNGNAYFSTESKKGFQSMTVRAGTNANNIIIDCSSEQKDKDDCKEMNVYASTAQYLRINVGKQLGFTSATVECPVNSSYSGPDPSPCVIDASNGTLEHIMIIAPEGTPKNVYIEACASCTNVQISCDSVDALNGNEGSISTYPFDATSACWWTKNPTINPTNNPTTNPTSTPTVSPSPPTSNPTTVSPTRDTIPPSMSPTSSPSDSTPNPTITPTSVPTSIPTVNPTLSTYNPTFGTSMPTTPPTDTTKSPTSNPTPNPTYSTLKPTISSPNTALPTLLTTFILTQNTMDIVDASVKDDKRLTLSRSTMRILIVLIIFVILLCVICSYKLYRFYIGYDKKAPVTLAQQVTVSAPVPEYGWRKSTKTTKTTDTDTENHTPTPMNCDENETIGNLEMTTDYGLSFDAMGTVQSSDVGILKNRHKESYNYAQYRMKKMRRIHTNSKSKDDDERGDILDTVPDDSEEERSQNDSLPFTDP